LNAKREKLAHNDINGNSLLKPRLCTVRISLLRAERTRLHRNRREPVVGYEVIFSWIGSVSDHIYCVLVRVSADEGDNFVDLLGVKHDEERRT